ncbi:MAG: lipoprotein-releasing ABC transporter permease subunit [Desulfohalobiaceae bacterium]|nr:lipoprotein-releasing ABC transporter permease subunit [Desulfohalobiaceae bacterium]
MRFELFIALRYLFSRRKHGFISAISLISMLGVALGVAALIIVLGVMNGFSQNLRDKILGVNAHVLVSSLQGPFAGYEGYCEQIRDIPHVRAVLPFVYAEVMLSSGQRAKGAVLRGVDPEAASRALSLEEDMVRGSFRELQAQGDPHTILLGEDLAARLGLTIGATVHMMSPSGKRSAAGFSPKIMNFRLAGVFDTGMYEYDSSLAYVSIPAAQEVLGFRRDMVTGLEVRLSDIYAAPETAKAIENTVAGEPLNARTWMEMNQELFSALKLEKTAMGIILLIMIMVGSFSIVTTLIMLVMEKKQDIAVLMSMGAKPGNIKRIFIYQGSLIGAIGTAAGYALGLGISYCLKTYQIIQLPQDIYYLDHIPIQLAGTDLTWIGIAAMTLCFLATLYPASRAAKLEPARVLRYE